MSETNFPLPPDPSDSAPGLFPILPMTFAQILDRIFRLVRSHFKPFAGIGILPLASLFAFYAVLLGVLALTGVLPLPGSHPPAQTNFAHIEWAVIPVLLLGIPAMLLVYGIYYAAASYAALQADHGRKVSVREALRVAWSGAGRFVWLMVLRALIVAVPIGVCVFAVFAGGLLLGLVPKGSPNTTALFFLVPLGALLYIGAVVYGIVMSLRLSLAFPACVHESLTARQAIARSAVLTKGAKGRIFLALLVIYAAGYAVVLLFYAVVMVLVAIVAVAGAGHFPTATPLTYSLLGVLVIFGVGVSLLWAVLLMAAYSTTFAVFYRDQCLRTD